VTWANMRKKKKKATEGWEVGGRIDGQRCGERQKNRVGGRWGRTGPGEKAAETG